MIKWFISKECSRDLGIVLLPLSVCILTTGNWLAAFWIFNVALCQFVIYGLQKELSKDVFDVGCGRGQDGQDAPGFPGSGGKGGKGGGRIIKC